MLFNSISFLFFFPAVTVLYFLLPHKLRWPLLLVASCVFYMAFIPWYILILALLIIVDYSAGLLIESAEGTRRKAYMMVSLISTGGVLFLFKYFNFFNQNISLLASFLHWHYSIGMLRLALPLGLSFHTFQSLSYVIEVYRGHQKAERHLGIYALYVMFFPQLVAGPIERPQHLLPQLHAVHRFDVERVFSGLQLMAWGFFKKLVIADRLGFFVDAVYADVHHSQGLSVFFAAVLFTFQLYCDFSGYGDIALGSARVLGIDLSPNFNNPFQATSHAEFWRRWHMSLSTWFRDYVYFPLARAWSHRGVVGVCAAVVVTFLLTGIWHGAGWNYVVLGLISSTYIVVGLLTTNIRRRIVRAIGLSRFPRLHGFFQVLIELLMVSFAWIFFRIQHLADALYVAGHMFDWTRPGVSLFAGYQHTELYTALVALVVVLGFEYSREGGTPRRFFDRYSLLVQMTLNTMLVLAIIVYGVFQTKQFIYFQF